MLMLKSLAPTVSHEELFLDSYQRLLSSALQLTRYDREKAEDLVHDAFIEFTLGRTDLRAVNDLDAYLYGILRNMHLSRVRRASQHQHVSLSAANYDSAEVSLRAASADPRERMRVREELRRICHYACVRKETSKAGSVLVLRFFHGYYPAEIARVMSSAGRTVDKWLWIARREARSFVDDSESLRFMAARATVDVSHVGINQSTPEFLSALREVIFRARSGDCLSSEQLRELYSSGQEAISCSTLSHMVSCRRCLDETNRLLGLPPLSERHATDSVGKDQDRGGHSGGTGISTRWSLTNQSRCNLRDVLEHRPKELRISVNGFILGAQNVRSDLCALKLSVNIEEQIGFVEVFSEQGIRLLFLEVSQPPDGEVEQRKSIELSDGRTLQVALSFNSPWPNLQVIYRDPTFEAIEDGAADIDRAEREGTLAPPLHQETNALHSIFDFVKDQTSRFWNTFSHLSFWLRPGIVTAVFAILLIAALLLMQVRGPAPTVSAAQLLRRSTAAEETVAARTGQVLHRTINLEERKETEELIASRHVDVWHSAERGITARRLYDDKGQLIAGNWRRLDGVETLYQHGAPPRIQPAPQQSNSQMLNFDSVWQLDLSSRDFSFLIGDAEKTLVEETPDIYVVSYTGGETAQAHGLIRARLVIRRADLRPVEQILFVRQEGEVHEFHFTEASFEQRAQETVAPEVFVPDPEFLTSQSASDSLKADAGKESEIIKPQPTELTRARATPELEVEVLRLLSEARADLNDQTSVSRTPDGTLKITGLVETERRKAEILRALAPLSRRPEAGIRIETVAEALRRQARPTHALSRQETSQRVEIGEARMPVYEELRKHFGGEEAEADEEIRRFAARVLSRSSRAMSQAGTMRRLARQFSPEELRGMSLETKAKWMSVIGAHARAFEQELRQLRQELQPIFCPTASVDRASDWTEITDDSSLIRAIEQVFELGATADDVIRSNFAISGLTGSGSSIKTPQFYRTLLTAEQMASGIHGRDRLVEQSGKLTVN